MWKPLFSTLRCVSVTPLGKPVVPEVYCRFTGSAGRVAASRAARSSSETRAAPARKSAHVPSATGSAACRPATSPACTWA